MEDARIRELRRRLGLSQERFAQLLGVSLQSVRRWESGQSNPLPIISLKLQELQRRALVPQTVVEEVPMRRPTREQAEVDIGLGEVFRNIGSLLELLARSSEAGKEQVTRSGDLGTLGGQLKGAYGFNIRIGLEGPPIIQRFDNVRQTQAGPEITETREPLVDILDEGDQLVIIAEVPGVEERDIHMTVVADRLEITAEGKDRKYEKEVSLPASVVPESLAFSHRNGILELRLAKREPETRSLAPGGGN